MNGFLLVDKPAGKTSHDMVGAVRRELGGKRAAPRVGHAGTLDPFATGLLVVLIGRATRVQRHVMALQKTYEAIARFGATSTTGDPEGEIAEGGAVPLGDLELPTGELRQRPPAYSAVKVGGRRAYAMARAGEEFELAERTVHVHRFDELWRDGPRRAFAIECSSGTYVRTLISELGDAYCEELRRTAIGPFSVADAGGPTDFDGLIGLGDGLRAFLPTLELAGETALAAAHGRQIEVPDVPAGDTIALVDEDGPIALAEPREAGTLKPVVGFRG